MKVYIVGAGPGDPELITVKGANLIKSADMIMYTGSLVPKTLIESAREDAVVYNSAGMNLDEIVEIVHSHCKKGELVARVHTGDPSIYGSTAEQMRRFAELGIYNRSYPWGVFLQWSRCGTGTRAHPSGDLPNGYRQCSAGRTPVPKKKSWKISPRSVAP